MEEVKFNNLHIEENSNFIQSDIQFQSISLSWMWKNSRMCCDKNIKFLPNESFACCCFMGTVVRKVWQKNETSSSWIIQHISHENHHSCFGTRKSIRDYVGKKNAKNKKKGKKSAHNEIYIVTRRLLVWASREIWMRNETWDAHKTNWSRQHFQLLQIKAHQQAIPRRWHIPPLPALVFSHPKQHLIWKHFNFLLTVTSTFPSHRSVVRELILTSLSRRLILSYDEISDLPTKKGLPTVHTKIRQKMCACQHRARL